jgi:hypothetical protein
MAGPLIWLRCSGCQAPLGRGHLETGSTVELKCHKAGCHEVTTFKAEPVATQYEPDGSGGYRTVAVVESVG